MSEITTLSPDLRARLPEIRDRWRGYYLSTAPADRDEAERGVEAAYTSHGYAAPREFLWVDSPRAATLQAAEFFRYETEKYISVAVWFENWFAIRLKIAWDVFEQFNTIIGTPLVDIAWYSFGTHEQNQIRSQIVPWKLEAVTRGLWGPFEATWYAHIDAIREFELIPSCDVLSGLTTVAKNTVWWWPFQERPILSERPVQLHWDDANLLHNATGPAVLYRDGFAVYAWHGVRVGRRIIEQPESITVRRIHREKNVAIRRVLVDRYGQARYLRDVGAKAIHRDEWGTLYHVAIPGDESLVMVKVVNSTREPDGTFRDYFLRVHPQIRPMIGQHTGPAQEPTALNAVASTFGLTGQEYLEAMAKQT